MEDTFNYNLNSRSRTKIW